MIIFSSKKQLTFIIINLSALSVLAVFSSYERNQQHDYSKTIIGRIKRDYVWFMARTPSIDEQEYQQLLSIINAQGYDISKVLKVPQHWPKEKI